jgi:hypothetical protein
MNSPVEGIKESLLRQYVERHRNPPEGWTPTSMTCSCGGRLLSKPIGEYLKDSHAIASRIFASKEPKYRMTLSRAGRVLRFGRRGFKKREAIRKRLLAHTTVFGIPLLRGSLGAYACEACGRRMGGYEAIGRNVFKVEPMPQGATPIYDRDPNVATIVTEEKS